MKHQTKSDEVSNRLVTLGFAQLPPELVEKIHSDHASAMAEADKALAAKITTESVTRDFRDVFNPRKSRDGKVRRSVVGETSGDDK